jgi:protein disulfide-isomerase A1
VIAYAKSENDVAKAYKKVADQLRDNFLFGYATDPSLAPSEAGFPSIVMYKQFDEGMVVVPEKPSSVSEDTLKSWIKEQSTPLMDQVSPENFASYADQGLPLAYLFIKPDDSRLNSLVQAIKPIAKAAKGKVNFVWIDGVAFVEHGKSLSVDPDNYPAVVIQDMSPTGKGKKYVYPVAGDNFKAEDIASWVEDFENGKLEPTLKSAPVPSSQDEPVHILVGEEFDKVVFDDDKDVLVEFYAPWCGHCQRLAPIWDSLGEHFEDFKNTLTIAKMDATENDIPPSAPFEVAGFPTIKFKRAGTRDFIDYTGDRSLEALISFVTENSNNPIEFEEELNQTETAVGGEVELEAEDEEESGHHDEL